MKKFINMLVLISLFGMAAAHGFGQELTPDQAVAQLDALAKKAAKADASEKENQAWKAKVGAVLGTQSKAASASSPSAAPASVTTASNSDLRAQIEALNKKNEELELKVKEAPVKTAGNAPSDSPSVDRPEMSEGNSGAIPASLTDTRALSNRQKAEKLEGMLKSQGLLSNGRLATSDSVLRFCVAVPGVNACIPHDRMNHVFRFADMSADQGIPDSVVGEYIHRHHLQVHLRSESPAPRMARN